MLLIDPKADAGHRRIAALTVMKVRLLVLLAIGSAGSLVGCGSIDPVAPADPPVTDATKLYATLALNFRAVALSTVAPYNTLTLTATPRAVAGNDIPGLPTPTYQSTDTSRVRVTDEGVITGVDVTEGTTVIASLTVGPVTHADTAVIQVTNLATPPTLASLSIHPVAPDSAVWPWQPFFVNGNSVLFNVGTTNTPILDAPIMKDVDGVVLSGLPYVYRSLDPDIATVDPLLGNVTIIRPGRVHITAETMAYGVNKADTVLYTITYQFLQEYGITPGPTGTPDFFSSDGGTALSIMHDVYVVPNGLVGWVWLPFYRPDDDVTTTIDVVFDDPTAATAPPADLCEKLINASFGRYPADLCGTGNVLIPPPGIPDGSATHRTYRLRQFRTPGIYPWHSTTLGISGRVIVTTDGSS